MKHKEQFYLELRRKLTELSIRRINHQQAQSVLCNKVVQRYGFPASMVSDAVTLRTDLEDMLIVLCYALAKTIGADSVFGINFNVESYFTEREIKDFSNFKYPKHKAKFPYTFESPMIEVVPDEQYIGRTSVKELMLLRDSQIINYNENTQRALTLKRGKDYEYYKITLNRNAVDSISELMDKGDFIPNTLTFNISPDIDFTYKDGLLTIKEETVFDILDGYHRYIAISNRYNLNNDFEQPMEIRIMFRNEENAKQFIHQEDQRTPLSRINSDAMNKNDVGVRVCRYLKGNLGNDIISQQGIINEPLMVRLIDILYVQKGMAYERSKIVTLANDIFGNINGTLNEVPELLDKKWDTNFTVVFMGLMKENYKGKELYDETVKICGQISKGIRGDQLTAKRIEQFLKERR